MPLISETLIAAKAIIETPAAWTQSRHARDVYSNDVSPFDSAAVCFCADGALAKAAGVTTDDDGRWTDAEHYKVVTRHMNAVTTEVTRQHSYVRVNDGFVEIDGMSPHEAILFLFDKGIERAKELEASSCS